MYSDYNQHIDHIIDMGDNVKLGELTVLTGNNGSGKSFLKKVLHQFIKISPKYMQEVSLDRRAGIRGEMDMFSRDCDWLPSSTQSFNWVEQALADTVKDMYIILDEPEIGMSEEFQAALAEFINSRKDDFLKNNKGLLVISHSRQLVKRLHCDNFLNMEGLSKEEWVNREVTPLDPKELEEQTTELMRAIEKRLVKKK